MSGDIREEIGCEFDRDFKVGYGFFSFFVVFFYYLLVSIMDFYEWFGWFCSRDVDLFF